MIKKLLLIAIIFILPSQIYSQQIFDRIVAVVNGEIITLSELNKYEKVTQMGQPDMPKGRGMQRQLLSQLIDKKIIEQEAENMDIVISEREIDRAINNILAEGEITLSTLQAMLQEQGISFSEYRQALREEMIQSEVIGRKVQSRINITGDDVKRYYEKNIKGNNKGGRRYRIQQIVLFAQPGAETGETEKAEMMIKDIKRQLDKGEDFGMLASMYCQGPAAQQGGDMGYFYKGELMPEIESAALALEPGQVSDIIRTGVGFHIIRLVDKQTIDEEEPWKAYEAEIRQKLYGKEFDAVFSEWMASLKEKSYIEINI